MAAPKEAPAKAVEHTITLTKGGIKGLSQMLTSPQWVKDDPEALLLSDRACTILEDVLPDLGKIPEFKSDDEAVAWESAPGPVFKLTERQRETCKKALTFFFKGGSVPNGKTKRALLRQFGLVDAE